MQISNKNQHFEVVCPDSLRLVGKQEVIPESHPEVVAEANLRFDRSLLIESLIE